ACSLSAADSSREGSWPEVPSRFASSAGPSWRVEPSAMRPLRAPSPRYASAESVRGAPPEQPRTAATAEGPGGQARLRCGAEPRAGATSRVGPRVADAERRETPRGRAPRQGQALDSRQRWSLLQVSRQLLDGLAAALDAHAHAPVLEVHDVPGES